MAECPLLCSSRNVCMCVRVQVVFEVCGQGRVLEKSELSRENCLTFCFSFLESRQTCSYMFRHAYSHLVIEPSFV